MPNEVEARGLPGVGRTARSFRAHTSRALLTRLGSLDIWPRPDGTEGYDDLVVHREDSIRIKRAIGGTKYLGRLPLLREVQQQRRKRGLD